MNIPSWLIPAMWIIYLAGLVVMLGYHMVLSIISDVLNAEYPAFKNLVKCFLWPIFVLYWLLKKLYSKTKELYASLQGRFR